VTSSWSLFTRINLIHVLQFYFFKLHFNIIFPSKPSLPSCLFSSGFPADNLYALFLSHTWYTAHPSHSRIINYEDCHYAIFLNFLLFLPFRSKYFPYHSAFEPPHSRFFPCERPRFLSIWRRKIVVLHILIFIFLDTKGKTKDYGLNYSSHFLKLIFFNLFLCSAPICWCCPKVLKIWYILKDLFVKYAQRSLSNTTLYCT